jgi:phosphoribosylglycinamide formyltransferase-1
MSIRLGVLLSGSGTNLQAIIDRIEEGTLDATIQLVVSSRPDAYGIKRAERHGLQTLTLSKEMYADPLVADEVIAAELKMHDVDYVIMAGYMRMVHTPVLAAYPNRVVNLHPALLPSFPGMHATRACWEYGARFSGCTVHFVSPVTDGGPIIIQAALPVHQDEDGSRLLERIHLLEHRIYPQALAWLAEGRLSLQGRRVLLAPGTRPPAPQPDMALVWPPLENGF